MRMMKILSPDIVRANYAFASSEFRRGHRTVGPAMHRNGVPPLPHPFVQDHSSASHEDLDARKETAQGPPTFFLAAWIRQSIWHDDALMREYTDQYRSDPRSRDILQARREMVNILDGIWIQIGAAMDRALCRGAGDANLVQHVLDYALCGPMFAIKPSPCPSPAPETHAPSKSLPLF